MVQAQLKMPSKGLHLVRWGQQQFSQQVSSRQRTGQTSLTRGTSHLRAKDKNRSPTLEARIHVGVVGKEVVELMGGSKIPHPQKSQALIVLLCILQKLEPGRKRTSHRNSFLAPIRQRSPTS